MAFDAFLKLDGIPGESQDKYHPGEIQLDSFSFGITQFTTIGSATGGAGAGKASLQDIHFSAPVSVASPKLFLACASGQHIKTGTLTLRKSGGSTSDEFLKYNFQDLLVSGYSTGSNELDNGFSARAGDQDLPSDQFSLNFHKILIQYTSPNRNTDGSLTGVTSDTGADAVSVQ